MKGRDANEILAQATKNTLGIELAAEDLDAGKDSVRELAPDALENVSGGITRYGFWNELEEECDELEEDIGRFFKSIFG